MKSNGSTGVKWNDLPMWCRVIPIIAITNFASFAIIAIASGGDALNGKEEAGRYFVMSHGRYTEVSPTFFRYSRVHASSVILTHSIAILGGIWLYSQKKGTPP